MEKNVLNTDLSGKVAVVTGASGTLCSIFAKALARAGAKVALLGRNMEKLKELANAIEAEGGVAKGYTCNVMNKANCLQVAEEVMADLGPCDILVNGAGGNNPRANTDKEFFEMADLDDDTVKNMGIYYSATTTSAPYKGLFGYVNGTSSSYATIQNLKVTGKMYLTSTGSVANAYSGGVVAYANYTNISGVVSDVDITVTRVNGNWSSVGGVAGRLVNSNATNCGNEGTIRAYQYVGGITGYATGTITGCYNGGAITGNGYVAGIVGQTTKGVTACYNTGSITGAGNYVAGIVAFASGASASVKNCYNRAYVESTGSNVGAVVGMTNNASAAMSNLYYLDFTCSQGIGSAKSTAQTATAKTRAEMTKSSFVRAMNTGLTTAAFVSSRYSPALSWQTNLKGLKTPKVGNVDMDPFGYVDSKDVELLRKYLANTITLNDDQLAQANVNGDTVVNQADLDLLEQYVAGTITVFPVG